MKKLLLALLVAVSVSGTNGIFACGGMTQIDPPCLQLEEGPADQDFNSVVNQLSESIVIC